jgi:transcriptional regulator with XRE-family HTH domain
VLQRLRRQLGRNGKGVVAVGGEPLDPLLAVGRSLREAREAHGLGLRQLAQETRISTAVLEALERGWRDRLPEPAYLRTMLSLLERRLDLPGGSLQGALPAEKERLHGPHRESLLRRFTPGSIDVFSTWQGTVLYGLLSLALLYGLNRQQRHLAEQGLFSNQPVPPLGSEAGPAAHAGADAALLEAHPDLRPLEQAAAGKALQRLRQESDSRSPDLSLGVLRMSLERPTRVELRSARGGDTTLTGVQGELALPVLPPFRLRLAPAPAAGAVLWKGATLAPSPQAGHGQEPKAAAAADYRVPPTAPSAPVRPLP